MHISERVRCGNQQQILALQLSTCGHERSPKSASKHAQTIDIRQDKHSNTVSDIKKESEKLLIYKLNFIRFEEWKSLKLKSINLKMGKQKFR